MVEECDAQVQAVFVSQALLCAELDRLSAGLFVVVIFYFMLFFVFFFFILCYFFFFCVFFFVLFYMCFCFSGSSLC